MTSAKRHPAKADSGTDHLRDLALRLSLTTLRNRLADLVLWAERDAPSYTDFTAALLRSECDAREERRLRRIRKRSNLPAAVEDLDSFNFAIRPSLDARVVRELQNCRWVEDARNIICVGRPGLGKTRVLDALAQAACQRGYSVLKVTTADMLADLHASLADGTFRRVFRRYEKPQVLYLEEFGYAGLNLEDTGYLFRLVSARHGVRSTLLAANTGFKHWKSFFPSEAHAVATVDRLIDRATILRFTGKSMREPEAIYGAETDEE